VASSDQKTGFSDFGVGMLPGCLDKLFPNTKTAQKQNVNALGWPRNKPPPKIVEASVKKSNGPK
jgi:hypothetical protein